MRCKDASARPFYLKAVYRVVLQNLGTMADLDRLEASYGTVHDDLERAQTLVGLKRLEAGRKAPAALPAAAVEENEAPPRTSAGAVPRGPDIPD